MSDEETITPPVEREATPARGATKAEVEQIFQNMLEKKAQGDPSTLAYKLIELNLKAKGEIEQLKAKLPPEGHVVLSKADADLLASYRALGDPEQLKASTKAATEAQQALDIYKALGDPKTIRETQERLQEAESVIAKAHREAHLEEVSAELGYSPPVLARLVTDDMEFISATEGGKNGKERKVWKVKDTGPDGKERERPIKELEEGDWAPMLPALKPAAHGDVTRPAQEQRRPVGTSPYRGTTAFSGGNNGEPELTPAQKNRMAALAAGLNGI